MPPALQQNNGLDDFSDLTLHQAKQALTQKFNAADIDFAEDDALELLMAAAQLDRSDIIMRAAERMPPEAIKKLSSYAKRRLSGQPVDHIVGWREFYGRRFQINKDVLSPRADTETLINHALSALQNNDSPHILDLGTGSGAILITLLSEHKDASGVGVDISQKAINIAKNNAGTLGVNLRADWHCGSWFAPLDVDMRFDAIVSNPPYITQAAMENLETEVKTYDPHIALYGGADGLDAYQHIIKAAKDWLKPSGWIGVEIGFDQKIPVMALLSEADFISIECHKDLGGNDRVVCARTKL